MTKFLAFLVIGMVFLVAFIYNRRIAAKTIKTPVGDRFEKEEAKTSTVKLRKPIDGRIFNKVWKDLKEFTMPDGKIIKALNQKNAMRKWQHVQRIEWYASMGTTWTPFGLYYSSKVC